MSKAQIYTLLNIKPIESDSDDDQIEDKENRNESVTECNNFLHKRKKAHKSGNNTSLRQKKRKVLAKDDNLVCIPYDRRSYVRISPSKLCLFYTFFYNSLG